jgi:hypothetical protein
MAYAFEEVFPGYKPERGDARDEDHIGLHHDCMFDLDERVCDGGTYDEITGERYDNSTFTDETIVLEMGHAKERAPRSLDRKDAAAKWLAENDPLLRAA